MKKKKYLIIFILIVIAVVICLIIVNNQKITAETTEEERKFWNDFLQNSQYIGEIDRIYPAIQGINYTEMIKVALVANDVKLEEVTEKDIENNFLLGEGKGYKKSRKEIEKYLEELVGIKLSEYRNVQTYVQDGEYLLVDDKYVYFTKIDVPEKVYIAMNYEQEEEDYTVLIYEYIVTDENREQLNEAIETGKISKKLKINNNYIIKGKKEGDGIKITYKYTNEEDITEVDEFMNTIPKDAELIE